MDKNKLKDIIFSIKENVELGKSVNSQIQSLHEFSQMPVEDLIRLIKQEEIDYAVERILLFNPISKNKTKQELIGILDNILKGSASEAQIDEWISILEDNVPYPDCVIDILDEEELTAGELLQKMLDYKPSIINL